MHKNMAYMPKEQLEYTEKDFYSAFELYNETRE
jgi:hypothetical protein